MTDNCYKCNHRGTVPGNAHSCCEHPLVKKLEPFLLNRMFMLGQTPAMFNIQADAHGIRSGWFLWPTNFDPVWLENCDAFELKTPPSSGSTKPDSSDGV